jgi:hypothetical protein
LGEITTSISSIYKVETTNEISRVAKLVLYNVVQKMPVLHVKELKGAGRFRESRKAS